jgi:hypothetical protein
MPGEPTTPTGKTVWADEPFAWNLDYILAIEAEARQQERERLRAEVETFMVHEFIDDYEAGTMWYAIDRASVLALLAEPSDD